MGLFSRKKDKNPKAAETEKAQTPAPEIKPAAPENTDSGEDLKSLVLKLLAERTGGELNGETVLAPYDTQIDIQIGRNSEEEGIKIIQVVFILRRDDLDEPIIEPVDVQGKTYAEAAKMAAEMFGGVWRAVEQAFGNDSPILVTADYLGQHYEYDMYCRSLVRVGVDPEKKPTLLVSFIKNQIPLYLGSKKYYWLRIYLAKYKDKQIIEVRVNGSVCTELPKYFRQYVNEQMDAENGFVSEKQYAFFVRRGEDLCPFDKETVMSAARETIEMMKNIRSREAYIEMAERLPELVGGNKNLAAEIRVFIPEIFAKMTLGFREGDSLFLLDGEGGSTEFRKTQLRSYFYLQQAVLEYLSTRPPQEDVSRVVFNSVAFRELRKTIQKGKEEGKEIKPADMFVQGTSYRIGEADYKVW